jgi:hypothetical protein
LRTRAALTASPDLRCERRAQTGNLVLELRGARLRRSS